jgi:Rieske Fe-S protein
VRALERYPAMKNVGGSLIGRVEGMTKPILVVHQEQGTYVATSAQCTHMACPVRYNSLNQTVDCTCHGSTFELDGSVINGPATKPLPTFEVAFDGQIVSVRPQE